MIQRASTVFLVLLSAFALALSACGDDDEPAGNGSNASCTGFCIGENAASNASSNDSPNGTSQNRADEIADICEDICEQEERCTGNTAAGCVAMCIEEGEDFLFEVTDQCYDATIEAVECVTDLTCSEFENEFEHCGHKFDTAEQVCDFIGPEPVNDPEPVNQNTHEPTVEQRIEMVCRENCSTMEECSEFGGPDFQTCYEECQEEAHYSYQNSDPDCFHAELEAAECGTTLSCEQLENFEEYCAPYVDEINEHCDDLSGSGSDGGF